MVNKVSFIKTSFCYKSELHKILQIFEWDEAQTDVLSCMTCFFINNIESDYSYTQRTSLSKLVSFIHLWLIALYLTTAHLSDITYFQMSSVKYPADFHSIVLCSEKQVWASRFDPDSKTTVRQTNRQIILFDSTKIQYINCVYKKL